MKNIQFIEKATRVHGNKYDYSIVEYINLTTKVKIILDGVIYEQTPAKHLLGRCPEKNTLRKTNEQFIEEACIIHGDKYDYSLVEYTGALDKVKILYLGKVYEQAAISHLRGIRPELCKSDTINFIDLAKEVHGDRYDYSLVDYKNAKSKVKIIFQNKIYEQRPTVHLSGAKPENINLAIRKTTEQFIIESNLIHNDKYDYTKTTYTKNQVKVIIICPTHGEFLQRPLMHVQGQGCPNCNESHGEKIVAKYLKDKKIPYTRQKKFKTCRNTFELPFDFWIPSKEMLIEFDGKQHFEPNDHFGGIDAFNNLKSNDVIKNNWAIENNVELLRIAYYDIDKIPMILDMNL